MLKNLFSKLFPLLAISGLLMAAWALVMAPEDPYSGLPYTNADSRFRDLTEITPAPAALAQAELPSAAR